jgi:leucyl aminopeptidase (aminopeptidase T)
MMKDQIVEAIDNIYLINLKVRKNEKVIVLTDNFNKDIKKISSLVSKTGEKHVNDIKHVAYEATGNPGVEPPEPVWFETFGKNAYKELRQKRLLRSILAKNIDKKRIKEAEGIIKKYRKEAPDAVIALSYFSTSHTRFRDMLNRMCGTRYASMPLFDEAMLTGPMRVDWKKMLIRTEKIAKIVNKFDHIEIESRNGTSISFSKKGREAKSDTGILTEPGSFSNLPAGEAYLAPLEGTAEGKLVLEWAPTRKLKSPVTLYVEKGRVKEVEGKEKYVDDLRKKLSEKKENSNIAELGIGTNDRASRPDNILESEKIFGTIHIALGDNSSFGGKVSTSFHQDFVFFDPTVKLINKEGRRRTLLKEGKLSKSLAP